MHVVMHWYFIAVLLTCFICVYCVLAGRLWLKSGSRAIHHMGVRDLFVLPLTSPFTLMLDTVWAQSVHAALDDPRYTKLNQVRLLVKAYQVVRLPFSCNL
jgi:hypothetical protein